MLSDLVGYRFFPTGEELINHYLRNQNEGKLSLVDKAISEINICSYEPKLLPSLAKIQSNDLVWYFFSPKEYTSDRKKEMKRTTGSGFWKVTGNDRKIKDKRGNGDVIGIKKTLVYHEGRASDGVRTPWVIHEYHITCLPEDQTTYVLCQVMYRGDEADISYGNNSNEPIPSLVSGSNGLREINTVPEVEQPGQEDGLFVDDLLVPMDEHDDFYLFDPNMFSNNNLSVQPQTPCDDDYFGGLLSYNGGNFNDVVSDQELHMPMNALDDLSLFPGFELQTPCFAQKNNDLLSGLEYFLSDQEYTMQENYNDYRPKKSLSGILSDYNSDSDAESLSAKSYQGTSIPGENVGSPNRQFPSCPSTDSCKDVQTMVKTGKSKAGDASSIDKESYIVKTEWLITTEKVIERSCKNRPYMYVMNMIIRFIFLLALHCVFMIAKKENISL